MAHPHRVSQNPLEEDFMTLTSKQLGTICAEQFILKSNQEGVNKFICEMYTRILRLETKNEKLEKKIIELEKARSSG